MRTLSELLGDHFFDLLEAGVEEACRSVRLLRGLGRDVSVNLEAFSAIREKSRGIASRIEVGLAHNIMASLKREDILALSNALCLISEAAERLAGRWILAHGKVSGFDIAPLLEMLVQSAETVAAMVRQVRIFDNETATKQLHAQLQQQTDAADGLGETMIRALLQHEQDPVKLVIVRDVVDHATALFSACADCGDLVREVVLKYA